MEQVETFLTFVESISHVNKPLVSAIYDASVAIFESSGRDEKKEYIIGTIQYIDPDGNIDHSNTQLPPDIEEQFKRLGITTDDLIEARNAFDKYQNLKQDLF